MKAVIVDDEKDSRDILANYILKYCPDVKVCGFGDSVAAGIKAIHDNTPDIVFLDIEMPYGNGFDLLSQIREVNFEVVFVTAFDNYAIQALNQSAAYYLLKPIDIDELISAVDKIKLERKENDYVEHTKVLVNNIQPTSIQKIMLPTLEGFEVVPINSIVYCEAVDNFTKFHFEKEIRTDTLMICRTLKYFEEVLKPYRFLRIHRSHMINPEYVIRYSKGKGGSVTMKNNIELEVSANKKVELLTLFGR